MPIFQIITYVIILKQLFTSGSMNIGKFSVLIGLAIMVYELYERKSKTKVRETKEKNASRFTA